MKGIYNEKMDEGLAQVKKEALPAEVTRGVNDIYVHYKKYMDVQDVEENTFEKMMLIYKQSGYRSKIVEDAVEAAEQEMNSYLDQE